MVLLFGTSLPDMAAVVKVFWVDLHLRNEE